MAIDNALRLNRTVTIYCTNIYQNCCFHQQWIAEVSQWALWFRHKLLIVKLLIYYHWHQLVLLSLSASSSSPPPPSVVLILILTIIITINFTTATTHHHRRCRCCHHIINNNYVSQSWTILFIPTWKDISSVWSGILTPGNALVKV